MFGNLTEEEIEHVLSGQILSRLGCSYNDNVYVVPISYAYDGTYIYVHTKEGRKTDMMRKNPIVCIQVDEMNNMSDWKSVICQGIAEELLLPEEKETAIKALVKRKLPIMASETTHLSPAWPFQSENFDDISGILFSIKIIEKTGRYEKFLQTR